MCPDNLFLEAFHDKLRLSGPHTHDEVEIEKALLLLEGPLTHPGNPVLGIYKFCELFKQEKYIILAESKFNFTTKDLYKAQHTPCYFDAGNKIHLENSLSQVNNQLEMCQNHITTLESLKLSNENCIKEQGDYIKALESQIQVLKTQLTEAQNNYNKIRSNFFVRVLLYIRRFFSKK